jgi:hypothetical protein
MPEIDQQHPASRSHEGNPLTIFLDSSSESDGEGETPPSTEAVQIHLEVEGMGSFKAGSFDTAKGHVSGYVEANKVIRIRAKAAPFHMFSNWTLNGNYAGNDASDKILPTPGLTIRAVFLPLGEDSAEGDPSREVIESWDLKGPGDSDKSRPSEGATRVKISNGGSSQFSIDFYKNGDQQGSLGRNTSQTLDCKSSDLFEVRSGASAEPGEKARGTFVYYP